MKQDDIIHILSNDDTLREAVTRRERKQSPMPADLNERLLNRIEAAKETPKRRRVWPYTVIAAACLLFIIGIGAVLMNTLKQKEEMLAETNRRQKEKMMEEVTPKQKEELMAEKTVKPSPLNNQGDAEHTPEEKTISVTNTQKECPESDMGVSSKVVASHRVRKSEGTAPPDTLGDGIWEQKENVALALQMLAECEAAGEQIQRNTIVEAAFQSTPKPHSLQLVVSETGDYMIVDDSEPKIIEL